MTADEFHLFMAMLNMTSIPKTVSGQAQLLEITTTMADLDEMFNGTDEEAVDKFVQCAKAATGFFSVRTKRKINLHESFFKKSTSLSFFRPRSRVPVTSTTSATRCCPNSTSSPTRTRSPRSSRSLARPPCTPATSRSPPQPPRTSLKSCL